MAGRLLSKVTAGDLELVGYSVAGEETVIAVPSLDVCFDIGRAPEESLTVNHVLLSHGHMDHAAGIAYYFSQRNFREMAAGTVLLPAKLGPIIDDLLDTWGRLDGCRPPANIVPMEPGQEYELRRNLYAYAFDANHCSDSLGYTIIERRQKLRKEFLGMSGPEIAKLKEKGVNITYTLNMPLVTFLGDTMGGDYEELACVKQSKVLVAECTFFDKDHVGRARAGKHLHIDQLAGMLEKMENEHIILTHLSRRTDLRYARKMLDEKLPGEIRKKVRFLMERPRRKKAEAKDE